MGNQQMSIVNPESRTEHAQLVVNTAGLNHFRLNPFQILRVSISASVKEAVWQEEKMLSLLRLALPLKERAPIPWLAIVNEMEIQQAVQKIEEPLERLVEQLFWFDFEADTRGGLLKEALATADADKLSFYLKETEAVPMLDSLPPRQRVKPLEAIETDHAAKAVEGTTSADTNEPDQATNDALGETTEADDIGENAVDKNEPDQATDDVLGEATEAVDIGTNADEELEVAPEALQQAAAHQLNRANLQFLLAVSGFHGVGPMIRRQTLSSVTDDSRLLPLSWQDQGRTSFCLNPHALLANSTDGEDKTVEWHRLWSDALAAWSNILQSPYFPTYVSHLIQRLEDELLDPGVVETLYRAIPTRFADILAGEIKNTIREGAGGRVTWLIHVASGAQFDRQIWETAFSSLNFYFQTELSDLTNLIEEPDAINPDTIRLYFSRLGQVRKRWQSLDPSDVMGLQKLLDNAVIKGYRAIASLSYVGHNLKEVQNLLDDAASYAFTKSVREKINSYKAQITKFHRYETCYFCEQRERDPNYPVVLKGKKEIETKWELLRVTTTYSIKHAIIPRCGRCAELQNYIHNTGLWLVISGFIGATIPIAYNPRPFLPLLLIFGVVFVPFIGYFLLHKVIQGIVYLVKFLNHSARRLVSHLTLPQGERAFFSIEDTEGYKDLVYEGYNIEKIDLRKDALKNTLASAGKSR